MGLSQGANAIVEGQLNDLRNKIETEFNADVLTYVGPIVTGADARIKDTLEALPRRKRKLVVILESYGGYAETARRIADCLRYHYRTVDFLIPSHAMSAGTILAMSGDAIWMDYYSILGPIDPQVPSPDGHRLIPALGYLVKYQELLDKANAGTAGAAELQILLGFNQGELYSFEQARKLSVSLLQEWLAKYKFKNWKRTQTRKLKVTMKMKRARAAEIAEKLNKIDRWNSHGLGINMEVVRRELKLKVDDFGSNKVLHEAIRGYHKLLFDYLSQRKAVSVVHMHGTFETLRWSAS